MLQTFEIGTSPQIVNRHVLDNGLILLTHKKSGLERKVRLSIGINFGNANEENIDGGVAHFIEHTVFRGNDDISGRKVLKYIEDVGGRWSAQTDPDTTEISIDIEQEYITRAMRMLKQITFEPNFGPKKVEKERDIIFQEIAEDDHDFYALVDGLFMKNLFEKHPIRNPVLGTRESLAKIDRETLSKYHAQYYTPGNIVACLSGDFEEADVQETIQLFSDIKKSDRIKREAKPELEQKAKFAEIKIPNSDWYTYLVGTKLTNGKETLTANHPDIHVVDLINFLLVAGDDEESRRMTGRLHDRVREQNGLVYSIGTDYSAFHDYGYFEIDFSREGDPKPVLDIISDELNKLRSKKISEEELRATKQFATSVFKEQIIDYKILARKLIEYELSTGLEQLAKRSQIIQAVSPEDIQRVASEYMNIDNLTVARISPK